jgi:hypothetical protein
MCSQPLPCARAQDVTLTLRQNSADGPKVADVVLKREEVPLKPKVRALS